MQGVPSSEMLRQSALQASWQRDRRLGARRRVWRWFEWLFTRWCLPVLVAAALGYVPASLRTAEPLTAGPPAASGAWFRMSRSLGPASPTPGAPPAVSEPAEGIPLKPASTSTERRQEKK